MTIAAPVGGTCAAHPGVAAQWACQRCGTFVCPQCERRTRPEAPPLCPACWQLREKVVTDTTVSESRRVPIGGLIIGVLSFLHPLIMVGSLVLNLRELIKGRGGDRRWMHTVGLVLTGLAILTWTVGIAFLATSR
ncbi:MAG: B-box zinc finger protein [Myxococcota bacterium]